MSSHRFTRPGQVAPDRPRPGKCMTCGQPEAAHRLRDLAADDARLVLAAIEDAIAWCRDRDDCWDCACHAGAGPWCEVHATREERAAEYEALAERMHWNGA